MKHTKGPWEVLDVESDKDYIRVRGTCLGSRYKIANVNSEVYNSTDLEEAKANARLISAAPELLEALTMGQSMNTPDFLDWVAERLIYVYGEHHGTDFILSLRERAQAGRIAIRKATEEK